MAAAALACTKSSVAAPWPLDWACQVHLDSSAGMPYSGCHSGFSWQLSGFAEATD
jgi:hypothetical protein